MTLTDELDSCGDGNILSNKERLRIIGKFLGVEAKTCNDIHAMIYPIMVGIWRIVNASQAELQRIFR